MRGLMATNGVMIEQLIKRQGRKIIPDTEWTVRLEANTPEMVVCMFKTFYTSIKVDISRFPVHPEEIVQALDSLFREMLTTYIETLETELNGLSSMGR